MKYVCSVCGFEYDEEKGYPEGGIAPGTTWDELPEDFECALGSISCLSAVYLQFDIALQRVKVWYMHVFLCGQKLYSKGLEFSAYLCYNNIAMNQQGKT